MKLYSLHHQDLNYKSLDFWSGTTLGLPPGGWMCFPLSNLLCNSITTTELRRAEDKRTKDLMVYQQLVLTAFR